MKKSLSILLVFFWIVSPGLADSAAAPGEQRPYGIALIGDPHLPGKNLPSKEKVIRTINGWTDIDRVVVLGDICKETGTTGEYAIAKKFFDGLQKPLRLVAGNHDIIYEDDANMEGRKVRASAATRRKKLARFAETFRMKELYSAERLGNYLLVYLSPDDLETDLLVKLSEERVAWLGRELAGHRDAPTIIFYHAPLAGTLHPYNERVNAPSFIAQPADRLGELLRANPQVFLWVAGHMHVPATNESYNSPVNVYEKWVTVIHNTDLERKRPWTNVLYLYPEKVVVRTYEHWQESWLPDMERTIRPPGR
jgi:3',5'-cyclic-AMP phosphodiesterase